MAVCQELLIGWSTVCTLTGLLPRGCQILAFTVCGGTFAQICKVIVVILNEHELENYTIMCLSIGTPKIINFPFVLNGKFIIFRCP